MKDEIDTARDDLVFLKALVSESGPAPASLGGGLLAGGLCYGIQCVLQWAMLVSGMRFPDALNLAVGLLPSLIFFGAIFWIVRNDRKNSQLGVGSRALNAAFGGSGLAAVTTATIFGYLAWREQSLTIWLFHPLMVCVVQGVVWYIAFVIRRRPWFGLVSGGWFASAILLAVASGSIAAFVFGMGLALLLLMALPGWILLRNASASG